MHFVYDCKYDVCRSIYMYICAYMMCAFVRFYVFTHVSIRTYVYMPMCIDKTIPWSKGSASCITHTQDKTRQDNTRQDKTRQDKTIPCSKGSASCRTWPAPRATSTRRSDCYRRVPSSPWIGPSRVAARIPGDSTSRTWDRIAEPNNKSTNQSICYTNSDTFSVMHIGLRKKLTIKQRQVQNDMLEAS